MSLARKGLAVLAVVTLVLVFAGCIFSQDKGAQDQQITKINFAITSISAAQTPVWIGMEKGFFKKYGLDLNYSFIDSSATATQALLSGDPPIVTMGATAAVNADLGGGDIVMVAGMMNAMPYELIVDNKKIQKPEDLKGKKIAVSRLGSSSHLAARLIYQKYNMNPEKDAFYVQIGQGAERFAALQTGNADGAIMELPFTLVANKAGFPTLVSMAELRIPFSNNGVATTRKFLKSNPDTVERFVKAIVASFQYMKANKDDSVNIISKYMQLDDKEAVTKMWEEGVGPLFIEDPTIPDAAIQVIIDDAAQTNEKAKTTKPSDYIDMSIVNKIKAAGFIDEIYGKKK